METCEVTTVVHLAAQAGVRYAVKNPGAYVHSNVAGFVPLMEEIVLDPEVAEKKLMERLRLSRHGVEEILHPPLGEGDFQNPAMSMRMSTHIRSIMEASE